MLDLQRMPRSKSADLDDESCDKRAINPTNVSTYHTHSGEQGRVILRVTVIADMTVPLEERTLHHAHRQ